MTTEDFITWMFVTLQMGVPIVAAFYACRVLARASERKKPEPKPEPPPADLPVAKVVRCRDK